MQNSLTVLFHNDETTIDQRDVEETTFKIALLGMMDKFRRHWPSENSNKLYADFSDALTQTDGIADFSWLVAFESEEVGSLQR